jgi:hypothetical protein
LCWNIAEAVVPGQDQDIPPPRPPPRFVGDDSAAAASVPSWPAFPATPTVRGSNSRIVNQAANARGRARAQAGHPQPRAPRGRNAQSSHGGAGVRRGRQRHTGSRGRHVQTTDPGPVVRTAISGRLSSRRVAARGLDRSPQLSRRGAQPGPVRGWRRKRNADRNHP